MKPVVISEFFDPVGFHIEDAGKAMYFDIQNGAHPEMFVRIHSWSEDGTHNEIKSIINDATDNRKLIKVTIETVDWEDR